MTDESKLPALPEAYALECGARFNEDGTVLMEIFAEPLMPWIPCETKQPLYTAAQMLAFRAEGVAAVAEDAGRRFGAALAELVFDGNAVFAALTERDRKFVGVESLGAVLDALVRAARKQEKNRD